ncbi:hypothetical protein PENSPDRAFT_652992 [Peniophora sp. CONT]|nr:hypothetical protein PENSPDRAFT_652992 [Peniophora sp. CONT]
MAAPAEKTINDLTGKWLMNKSLSDSTDDVLSLQGVGWMKRKIIAAATVTLHVKHYHTEDSIEHVDIRQTVTGGFEGTTENRTLDYVLRAHDDHLFGPIKANSRRVKWVEIEIPFLKEGWLGEGEETIEAYATSDTEKSGTSWTAIQTWGFEDIGGARRYVRHLDFTGPKGEHLQKKLVYDYLGENDA